MTKNRNAKLAARALAAEQGISYTAARAKLQQTPPPPSPTSPAPISPGPDGSR